MWSDLAGFWLADAGKLEEALPYYERCMARQPKHEHGQILAHLGSLYHQLNRFIEAHKSYQNAIISFEKELQEAPKRLRARGDFPWSKAEDAIHHTHKTNEEQIRFLEVLDKAAQNRSPFSGKRVEWGLSS